MVNNNNLNATPSSSLSSMSGSTNTNTNTSTSSPNKNNIMKGFLKRKPFRSPASSSTTTTSSHTNNNTNYNNYNTNGMTKKKSNETLEEAYHRLKRNSNNKNNNDNEQSQFQLEQRSIFLTSTSTSSSDSQTQSESYHDHHDHHQQQEQQKQHNYDDVQSTTTTTTTTTMTKSTGPRKAMSKDSIIKDESKLRKILIRLISGILMVGIFVSTMFCGHLYICSLIFLTEILLFRELLTVRYNTFFHIIEETIPLFRTTQWMWFVTAIVYTYSDFVVEVIKSNTSLHHLLHYARFNTIFSFLLYSATFVVSIATMHKDHIRFQLNQLCWTVLVLCLTVGQLKYIMHNVYNGLIWFALPIMLVVFNDSFAWLAGVTCGRKFIHKEFIGLSPNKTWEGFLGGWIGTMIAGWHLSRFMAQYTWMTCPTNNFSLLPERLECELDPIFQNAKQIVPSQIWELFPRALVQAIPGIVDICMVNGNVEELTACISGQDSHSHHHFELVIKNFYPVQIHALGLSLFASFVAPFGGFLASAIKRAYGLKDFASYIPGHGGMMDRMDCQFLMALCTWVHFNTFVKMDTISVPKMIYMFNSLNDIEQREFLRDY